MKRSIFVTATTLLLTVTVLFAAPPYRQAGAGSPEIIVLLDGLPVHFDVPPQIINGRTLVPFRLIAEAQNISVSWDGTTRTVSASEGGKQVILQIDNNTGIVNGSAIILDTAPVIIDSRTLIASPPCSMNVIGGLQLRDGPVALLPQHPLQSVLEGLYEPFRLAAGPGVPSSVRRCSAPNRTWYPILASAHVKLH